MNQPLIACIIGLGRAGRFHLTSFQQLPAFQLKYVVDPGLEELEGPLTDQGIQLVELETALADPEVGVAVISAPTAFHFAHISQALKAGKHVFAEKPLGTTLEEINQCYDLAVQKGMALHLGFQRRVDHNFLALKAQIPHIGPIRIIKTSSRDNPQPSLEYLRISGNIFHDMLIHDFDMLSFLLGSEVPSSIYAVGHAYDPAIAEMEDFDTVMVQLHYPSGLMVTIDTSRTAVYGYDQRIELFGEEGMAIAENERDSTVQIYTETGMQVDKVQHSFPQRYRDAYRREMEQFAAGIQQGELYPISRRDCILSHLIADAAHQSALSGQPVDFAKEFGEKIPE